LTVATSLAVMTVVVGVVALSGPGSRLQHNPGPADPSGSPAATQDSNGTLTDQEYAFALDLARHEIRQDHVGVTSATVTVGRGRVTDSSPGYSCTSGRLLHIKLIGSFPDIVTTGHPVEPGATAPDFTVHAVDLTADAEAGGACLRGVQTGDVEPAPGAVSLSLD
jgi:hypothetical protein